MDLANFPDIQNSDDDCDLMDLDLMDLDYLDDVFIEKK